MGPWGAVLAAVGGIQGWLAVDHPVAVAVLPPLSPAGLHSAVGERAGAGWWLSLATAGGWPSVSLAGSSMSLFLFGEAPHWVPV